ncbi:phosphoribosyl-AMP cyclohydrolase [Striga asiatica]|uniref:Phosphoribosyl-AMP cyclohydrolase n=1 Tax=Striga asiatica TaxID=4170 RepID=A0A5A7PMY4_STRAF|nr:phosphoribosyl-AMP cyclohydrolase [Striga asiatica]
MDWTSSKAGAGSELNAYDIKDGWIMTAALFIDSRFVFFFSFIFSSAEPLLQQQPPGQILELNPVDTEQIRSNIAAIFTKLATTKSMKKFQQVAWGNGERKCRTCSEN